MIALVCGGRNYEDFAHVCEVLDSFEAFGGKKITSIVHGAARGADTLAARWAEKRGIPARAFPANWELHGRAAGHVRNKDMLLTGKPRIVIAFPGGRGTANMMQQARQAGVNVVRIR
jgi:hypothetical protein